ncbi:hypothetical protein EDB19DRAFT_1836480 [Suillus lakei]|nr:hypothetical protein EDB19DRAFT_1836480 [Suillus lakei]
MWEDVELWESQMRAEGPPSLHARVVGWLWSLQFHAVWHILNSPETQFLGNVCKGIQPQGVRVTLNTIKNVEQGHQVHLKNILCMHIGKHNIEVYEVEPAVVQDTISLMRLSQRHAAIWVDMETHTISQRKEKAEYGLVWGTSLSRRKHYVEAVSGGEGHQTVNISTDEITDSLQDLRAGQCLETISVVSLSKNEVPYFLRAGHRESTVSVE